MHFVKPFLGLISSIWHLSMYVFTMQRDKHLKRNQTAVLSGNNRVQVERCAPKRLINGTK